MKLLAENVVNEMVEAAKTAGQYDSKTIVRNNETITSGTIVTMFNSWLKGHSYTYNGEPVTFLDLGRSIVVKVGNGGFHGYFDAPDAVITGIKTDDPEVTAMIEQHRTIINAYSNRYYQIMRELAA